MLGTLHLSEMIMSIDKLLAAACKPFDGRGFVDWQDEEAILMLFMGVARTDGEIDTLRSHACRLRCVVRTMRSLDLGRPSQIDAMLQQLTSFENELFQLGSDLRRACDPISHVVLSKPPMVSTLVRRS